MKLLIVESPGKIKKIKGFLGDDWIVKASFGHIRDLPSKELSIDKANKYKMLYQVQAGKQKVVQDLLSAVKTVGLQNVYLATDPDREGEAISFHLAQALNLSLESTKRITFNDITESSIKNALSKPRTIDLKMVAAQEARRAIDRLVGYQVSPILWTKMDTAGVTLSAGRVQSVALRMVANREREINSFNESFKFRVSVYLTNERSENLKAFYNESLASDQESVQFIELLKSNNFVVKTIIRKPTEQKPPAPFSTSSLQQAAVKKLKFTVQQVMETAQSLYEQGHITYMRTDSENLSDEATRELCSYIEKFFGKNYVEERKFKNKNASAQEAHEAIRPTHFETDNIEGTEDQKLLYGLIYNRSLASQMKNAKFDLTNITLASDSGHLFSAKASVLVFDGFKKIYDTEEDEDSEDSEEAPQSFDNLVEGQVFKLSKIESKQVFSAPQKRFNQATLVQTLEKNGIGRPSTYASILETIQVRKYVETGNAKGKKLETLILTYSVQSGQIESKKASITLGGDKGVLLPTDIGMSLTMFLEKHFNELVDYSFTASMEDKLDHIASGNAKFLSTVNDFDTSLMEWIELVNQSVENHPNAIRTPKTVLVGLLNKEEVRAGKTDKGTYIIYKKNFFSVPLVEPDQVTIEIAQTAIDDKIATDKLKVEALKMSFVRKVGKLDLHKVEKGYYVTDGKIKAYLKVTDSADDLTEDLAKDMIKKMKAWIKKKNKN